MPKDSSTPTHLAVLAPSGVSPFHGVLSLGAVADTAGATLYGEAGNNVIGGSQGGDILAGGQGDDFIEGGNDADSVLGEIGDDVLSGGHDQLDGGADNDHLWKEAA